ncbi:hypothetical protein FOCC_FOCC000807 [Frankliniella occidentalis]|nr:hypothetical protein FOCC_FOCC000807 [Frankliniella occidentalis]
MEINAHALIQNIVKFREEKSLQLFQPWLFSSQPCERLFRSARSLTSTYSTVANFSILEMLHTLQRIEYLTNASLYLRDRYNFPRHVRAFEAVKNPEYVCSSLPQDYEIDLAVQTALQKATKIALDLEIIKEQLEEIPLLVIQIISNLEDLTENADKDKDFDGIIITGEDEGNLAAQEMEKFDDDLTSDVLDDMANC